MKRRWEQETPINDENLEEIKENILSRIQFFHSQGFIDKPVSIEDEKQKMNAFSKEELAELCSQIEAMDNEICLRFLDKFLQQKETFRQLRNKLMVQGPKLRTITDLCWNLKVDYFDLKKDIAKRKESEALESVEGEKKEGESEHSEESASEEYESVTQMQYRKSIQFLKSLIQANEKKFTG